MGFGAWLGRENIPTMRGSPIPGRCIHSFWHRWLGSIILISLADVIGIYLDQMRDSKCSGYRFDLYMPLILLKMPRFVLSQTFLGSPECPGELSKSLIVGMVLVT